MYMLLGRQKGFTLIEIVIVLSIIGIMTAVVVPNFLKWRPGMLLKSASRDLYSSMQKAKIEAVKTNTTVTFNFTSSSGDPCKGGRYRFVDGLGATVAENSMADGICLNKKGGSSYPSGFTSNATPSGGVGTIVLSHSKIGREYEITLSWAGNIRLQ